jgi:hypothetical protein
MTRIIPQKNVSKVVVPSWLNAQELINASQDQVERNQAFQKNASSQTTTMVVAQYACPSCRKVIGSDAPELKVQEDLAKRASKTFAPQCSTCQTPLAPYKSVPTSSVQGTQRQGDMTQDLTHKSGTYNTYVDRHMVYRAVNALQNYASQNGMQLAHVRYLKAEHTKQAGQEYPMLNNIECEIQWKTTPKVSHTVTATISIDQAGMAKMPLMMTLSDKQTVVPFTKESVQAIGEKYEFDHMPEMKRKRTDQATYKHPDISRFHALASQEPTDTSSIVDELVESSKKKVEGIEKIADAMVPGVPPPVAPTSPVQYTPNQAIVNPADGKTYNVKQQSTTGITVTDPLTQAESIIPADQMANVRPAVKTTSFSVSAIVDELLGEKVASTYGDFLAYYGRDIMKALNIIRKGSKNISEGQWQQIESRLEVYDNMVKSSILHWINSGYTPDLQEVANLAVENQNATGTETKQISNALEDVALILRRNFSEEEEDEENTDITSSLKKTASQKFAASTRPLLTHVAHMSQDWATLRKGMKTKSQLEKEAKDIGYDAKGPQKDKTGHDASGVPFAEEKEITIGLTEFPKDQKKEDSNKEGKGYKIPFKKMDENQVEEREQFDNKQRLHIPSLQWKDLMKMVDGEKPDENLGLNHVEKTALLKAIGMRREAADDAPVEEDKTPELPIQHKDIKTAPKIKEFTEPAAIEPSGGKLKEAITKWNQVKKEIASIKSDMENKVAPLRQAVSDASAPFVEQQGKLAKELQTYMELVWSKLGETEDRVAAYEDTILARVERQIETGGKASLPELLAEVEKKAPEILAKLNELKQQLDASKMQHAVERLLYEYPVSKSHEKKVKASTDSFSFDEIMSTLVGWVDSLSEILNSIPAPEAI